MYFTFPFVSKHGSSGDMSLRFKIRTGRKFVNSSDQNRISLTQKYNFIPNVMSLTVNFISLSILSSGS